MPIDPAHVEDFDPLKVPIIDELCAQLERCDLINTDKKIKGFLFFHYVLKSKLKN